MKQETLEKAKDLESKIFKTECVVNTLKNKEAFIGYYFHGLSYKCCISNELQKRILPICEQYLKKLEKEFEEL